MVYREISFGILGTRLTASCAVACNLRSATIVYGVSFLVSACSPIECPDGTTETSAGACCPAANVVDENGICVERRAPRSPAARSGDASGVELMFPWNGWMGAAAAVSFRWRGRDGGSQDSSISYEIQVDDSCDIESFRECSFSSPELSESTQELQLSPTEALPQSEEAPVGRR